MPSSTSEDSSSGSEVETPTQVSPRQGTTLASKRKGTFEPPRGAILMGGPDDDVGAIETGEFDWNSVKDDKDIELWLVRVPNSVRSLLTPLLPPFSLFRYGHRVRPCLTSVPRDPDR